MLDFAHILESSLGLTFGGILLKLLDKTCKASSPCNASQPPVQTIINSDTDREEKEEDSEREHDVWSNASDVTIMTANNNEHH